jgi:hypothetical protein
VIVAHNSFPHQGMVLGNAGTYTSDAYCLIANNSFRSLTLSAPTTPVGVKMINNRLHTSQTVPLGGLNFAIGGSPESLYVDGVNGDFTPAGLLASDLRTPVVKHMMGGKLRGSVDALGAIAISGVIQTPDRLDAIVGQSFSQTLEPGLIFDSASLSTMSARGLTYNSTTGVLSSSGVTE